MRVLHSLRFYGDQVVAAFLDRDVEDALLRHLVYSVFSMRASLYASIAMSVAMVLAAAGMAANRAFLWLLILQAIVGAARISIAHSARSAQGRPLTRGELLAIDRRFTFWSAVQALILGACFCALETAGAASAGLPLAVGGAVGFCVAFTTRSAGRIGLLSVQVTGVAAPVAAGFIAFAVPFAAAYALLFAALAVCVILMGLTVRQRMVEHFRIDESNRRLAQFDTLTGLNNRFAFNTALTAALRDPQIRFALLTVDLDRFKSINDTAGHLVGDQVLVETANRLRALAGPEDFVARLGGDEFVVIASRPVESADRGEALAKRIVGSLRRPFVWQRASFSLGCSVGVALVPEHADSVEELMKRSDLALYEAKLGGRGQVKAFDVAMQTQFDDARRIEFALEDGLRLRQFEAWFQPILDLRRGSIIGYEALARWRHPEYGLVPPDRFIPIAERTGAIGEIGRFMLAEACRAAALWPRQIGVSVNLSPVQFRNADDLVRHVREALGEAGLDPARLCLEITESEMLQNTLPTRIAIHRLRTEGVRFALDDFGAGYSSLSYIQDYPFSRIKIDRKFVARLGEDAISSAVIASVCALAARLDLEVVAEGVETTPQQSALAALGVALAQGYLYGKPVPLAKFDTVRPLGVVA